MSYIYYCPKCRSTYSTEKDNRMSEHCPTCNAMLFPTHITTDEWSTKTDDEKENLKNGFDGQAKLYASQMSSTANPIGNILHIVGAIFISLCIIGGVILIREDFTAGLIVGIFGCLGGLLLLGFGEVVNLLQAIKDK